MQAVLCMAEPRAAPVAVHSTNNEHKVLPARTLDFPRMGLKTAGFALLASSTLLLAPMTADAAPTLTFASPIVKQKMEERDNAMDFKCKGGMFDCDSDRRDFAKMQYANFTARLEGKPQTKDGLAVSTPSPQQDITSTNIKK